MITLHSFRATSENLNVFVWFCCEVIARTIGSARHKSAKRRTSFLQPVLYFCSSHAFKDFSLSEFMHQFHSDPRAIFLCSFYISSLFLNTSLTETTQICADTEFNSELVLLTIPKIDFLQGVP